MFDAKSINEIKGTVALFKAIPMDYMQRETDMVSAYECIRNGFVFSTYGGTIVSEIPKTICDIAQSFYGNHRVVFNSTFHKSFGTVARMSEEEYFMDQFAHYFSTYGRESFGLKAIPYIPTEALTIPNVHFNADKIVVITVVENYVLINLVNKYAANTVSPDVRALEWFGALIDSYLTIPAEEIKSFELQTLYYDMSNEVPEAPITALRYLVYKATKATLIVKNEATCRAIKYSPMAAYRTAATVLGKNPRKMAEIFFRYKPIFLAFKSHKDCGPVINHIRRLADKYHKPLPALSFQNLTSVIFKNGITDEVKAIIEKASNREIVKLINSIGNTPSFSGKDDRAEARVFNIRNGKTFVDTSTKAISKKPSAAKYGCGAIDYLFDILSGRLVEAYKGKTFFVPSYIEYTVPTTEKQMLGNLPWGTHVVAAARGGAYTAGICWNNQDDCRVDLDLHMTTPSNHYGWNGDFRDSNGSEILYTGDMTDARNGAAEAFWFTPNPEDPAIFTVNKFCGNYGTTDFHFAISSDKPGAASIRNRNYTFDTPLFPPIPLRFEKDKNSMTLGLSDGFRFYFYGGSLSNSIVPSAHYHDYIMGILAQVKNKVTISDLAYAISDDVTFISEKDLSSMSEKDRKKVIDLSPEALTATTLLDFIDGKL